MFNRLVAEVLSTKVSAIGADIPVVMFPANVYAGAAAAPVPAKNPSPAETLPTTAGEVFKFTRMVEPVADVFKLLPPSTESTPASDTAVPASVAKLPADALSASKLSEFGPTVYAMVPPVLVKFAHVGAAPPPSKICPFVPFDELSSPLALLCTTPAPSGAIVTPFANVAIPVEPIVQAPSYTSSAERQCVTKLGCEIPVVTLATKGQDNDLRPLRAVTASCNYFST